MTTPSYRDIELLSASLDGQLSGADQARLEARLKSEPELAALLAELRQTRAVLRGLPQRRVPRNFTLTPKMAGLRAPVPRAVPALSWASAVATLLFVCTLGTNLLGRFSFGAAAPMMAAPANDARQGYGIGGGPAPATEAPVAEAPLPQPTSAPAMAAVTPTPEIMAMSVPQETPVNKASATPEAAMPVEPTPEVTAPPASPPPEPVNPWPYIWLGLAVLLIGSALIVRWQSQRAFRKKFGRK